jgi:hypothetical protein
MQLCCRLSFVLLLSLSAVGQSMQSMAPQAVEFPGGNLRLTAYLWKSPGTGPSPAVLFNQGSGGADADHTAGMPITQAANVLAPFSVECGTCFCIPFVVVMAHLPAKHHSCRTCYVANRYRRGNVIGESRGSHICRSCEFLGSFAGVA